MAKKYLGYSLRDWIQSTVVTAVFITYLVWPNDLIPDGIFPVIGYLDDAILGLMAFGWWSWMRKDGGLRKR